MNDSIYVYDDLVARVKTLVVAAGADDQTAELVAEGLVEADARGLSSHGLMLLPMYLDRIEQGSVDPTGKNELIADIGGLIVLDSNNGLGQQTAQHAMELAIDRARLHGVGIVACKNAFHLGGAYRYATLAANAGMIGLAAANTRPLMPAPGGAQAVVGNNPISFAFPRAGDTPIVFDLALSEAAMGKIRIAEAEGTAIPESWATDASGVPTTDPTEAIKGMLLPTGGTKGFGLALVVDMLTGVLSGGGFGNAVHGLYGDLSVPYNSAATFLAIDAAALDEAFPHRVEQLAEQVLASSMTDAAEVARLPGQRSEQNLAESMRNGVCLKPSVVKDLEHRESLMRSRN